jgi:hypothetical protein
MLGGVGAPGAPLFRLGEKLLGNGSAAVGIREGPHETNVRRRECIGLPELA